jgi:hypothetical protein
MLRNITIAYGLMTGLILGVLTLMWLTPPAQPSLEYEAVWLGRIPDKAIDYNLSGHWILTH